MTLKPKPKPSGASSAPDFESFKKKFFDDELNKKQNVLLLGSYGSGKTWLSRTMPGRVFIDCFDPGGVKGLRSEIESGKVVVDTTWQSDSQLRPTAFRTWHRTTLERIKSGFFNHVDTYMLDSTSLLADAIMNEVMAKAGLPGSEPRGKDDYVPAKAALVNSIKLLLSLPCHVVVTGHLKDVRDREGNILRTQYNVIGAAAETIPSHFDEVWVMSPKSTPKGTEYRIQLKPYGLVQARSRLAGLAEFGTFEPADFSALLRRAGVLREDSE